MYKTFAVIFLSSMILSAVSCTGSFTDPGREGAGLYKGGQKNNTLSTGNRELIAKWYSSETYDTVMYEFTADGKILVSGADSRYTYTAADTEISVKLAEVFMGTAKYTISGNKLTLSAGSVFTAGAYYKK